MNAGRDPAFAAVNDPLRSGFASDVLHYLTLTPRQLPSRYLYDALGSALFEAICELPWYGITRAEGRLLAQHRREILARLPGVTRIVELGPGTGRKLRTLVDDPSMRGLVTVDLVDVSVAALEAASRTLSAAENLVVVTHKAPFDAGLKEIGRQPHDGGRTVVLFLGSNIGNFDPPAATSLLESIRAFLPSRGALLLGADLVKRERDLLLAYDDPLGVSAAFNLNVLVRINRELGGHFDVRSFRHRAIWNPLLSRMEMYVVAARHQRVHIDLLELDVDLADGEPIWTETSHKYQPDDLVRFVEGTGFRARGRWIDAADCFALLLFEAA